MGVNILSLCDGMSCCQIALDELNINTNDYYASEIDKYAIKVTQSNYPETVQLGDVTELGEEELKQLPKIDLLIAGTPCKNLSRAVINRDNYNQGLEGEESKLFYDYARILEWLKNNNNNKIKFVLENVNSMNDEDKNIITDVLNVEPIMINSKLTSAQDRKRYYWTNLHVERKPEDENIVLKDVVLTAEKVNEIERNGRKNYWYEEDFEFHGSDKRVIATLDINGHDILKRVYNLNSKAPTLTTCTGGNREKKVYQNGWCRKLTPLEYERLQNVPEGYTDCVSATRRYNMLGNGFTIGVIKHILKNLK